MKKWLFLFLLGAFLIPSYAQATLTTIGTATYLGNDYNLIFEGDLGSDGLVWLDYTNFFAFWDNQVAWASGLSFSDAEVTIFSDYTTSIDFSTGWRLPDAGTSPTAGYNVITSEMGNLFYNELGLDAGSTSAAELNATNFDNLIARWYWSGTECAPNSDSAWDFNMTSGEQYNRYKTTYYYGLALLSGQVSAADPVPEPATLLLISTGIAGFAGYRRKRRIIG